MLTVRNFNSKQNFQILLYTIIYDHIWLYLTPYMIVHDNFRIQAWHMIIYDHTWPFMTIYDHIWLNVTPYMMIHDDFLIQTWYMIIYDLNDHIDPYIIMYDNIRLYVTSYMTMFKFKHDIWSDIKRMIIYSHLWN